MERLWNGDTLFNTATGTVEVRQPASLVDAEKEDWSGTTLQGWKFQTFGDQFRIHVGYQYPIDPLSINFMGSVELDTDRSLRTGLVQTPFTIHSSFNEIPSWGWDVAIRWSGGGGVASDPTPFYLNFGAQSPFILPPQSNYAFPYGFPFGERYNDGRWYVLGNNLVLEGSLSILDARKWRLPGGGIVDVSRVPTDGQVIGRLFTDQYSNITDMIPKNDQAFDFAEKTEVPAIKWIPEKTVSVTAPANDVGEQWDLIQVDAQLDGENLVIRGTLTRLESTWRITCLHVFLDTDSDSLTGTPMSSPRGETIGADYEVGILPIDIGYIGYTIFLCKPDESKEGHDNWLNMKFSDPSHANSPAQFLVTLPLGAIGNPKGPIRLYVASSAGEGFLHDDVVPILNMAQSTGNPDLVPYKRSEWDDKLVISNQQNTTTSASKIYDDENIYVDYCCASVGTKDAGAFHYGLYIDGIRKKSVTMDLLKAGTNAVILDSDIGTLSAGNHTFEIYCDYDNEVSESDENNNKYLRSFYITQQLTSKPVLNSFSINNGASSTTHRTVTLNNSATSNPTHYIASENSSFSGASWLNYSASPKFTLNSDYGNKTVYFKVKNADGESNKKSDSISYEDDGCIPNWEPAIYTNSTTAYGIVTINGKPASEGDIVAAFVGDECRAVDNVVMNDGVAYISLVINGDAKENIRFKIGDKSECRVYDVNRIVQTDPGNTIGNPSDYLQIEYTSVIEQTVNLNMGWNLISLYVNPEDMAPTSVFDSITSKLVQVKSTKETYDPNLSDFLNTLKQLKEGYGYWVKVNQQIQLKVSGQLYSSIPIQLNQGWNLVAYPYQQGQQVVKALEGIASVLLQVKSTNKTYDPNLSDFLNTLKTLEPGEGYWIKTSEATSLVYPESYSFNFNVKSDNRVNILSYGDPDWKEIILTNSTTAYGIVTIGGEPASEGNIVGAFVGNECRAVGKIVVNEGTAYVTLVIQGEDTENVSFKLYDISANTVLEAGNNYQTYPGNTIGQPPDFLEINAMPLIFGDFNSDGFVDLADAIFTLKIICGVSSNQQVNISGDVNGDGVAGSTDLVYILQKVAHVR